MATVEAVTLVRSNKSNRNFYHKISQHSLTFFHINFSKYSKHDAALPFGHTGKNSLIYFLSNDTLPNK